VAPPVFKTGLAGNTLAGRFDSFPPPPQFPLVLRRAALKQTFEEQRLRAVSDFRRW
jgi:hypothetical protein